MVRRSLTCARANAERLKTYGAIVHRRPSHLYNWTLIKVYAEMVVAVGAGMPLSEVPRLRFDVCVSPSNQ